MALQLAQAISTRVPRGDPVHEIDQAAALDAMLRKVDRADRADHVSRPGSEAGLIRLLPHESWTTPETQRLARIVGYVRRTGPLMEIETLEHKRAAVMRHLETPEEPLMGAAEFAEGLRVFTHREFDALSSPDAPWPGSLPARLPLERAVISKRMQAYSVNAEEEKAMAEAREREEAPTLRRSVMTRCACSHLARSRRKTSTRCSSCSHSAKLPRCGRRMSRCRTRCPRWIP